MVMIQPMIPSIFRANSLYERIACVNSNIPPRIFQTKKADLYFCLIVVTSLLISCRGTMTETLPYKTTIQVEFFVPQTITPGQVILQTSDALTPTTLPTKTPLPTRTPYPPTKAPIACPPFPIDTELPDPDIPENYIGRHYDLHNRLPEGSVEKGCGVLIRDISNQTEFGLTHLLWHQYQYLYWLEKLVCQDMRKRARLF